MRAIDKDRLEMFCEGVISFSCVDRVIDFEYAYMCKSISRDKYVFLNEVLDLLEVFSLLLVIVGLLILLENQIEKVIFLFVHFIVWY